MYDAMSCIKFYILILLLLFKSIYAQSDNQENDSLAASGKDLTKFIAYTSVYYASSMFILGNTWYKDKKNADFHFYNDNHGFMQVDKFGHAFGAYVYSYIGYNSLRKQGLSKEKALLYGASLGLVLQAPIEIMDGIHEGYGFSWGDMAANTAGSALVIGQEMLFDDQICKLKFSYSKSDYADRANGLLGKSEFDKLLKDYNGHTYWFSLPVNVFSNNNFAPEWLSVAIGYGADGMYGEFDNSETYNLLNISPTARYRQYFFSLDIDWSKIKTNSVVLKTVLNGLTFVKLPFPAIEYNSKGRFVLHLVYF